MNRNLMSSFEILNQDTEEEPILRSETDEDYISKLPDDALRKILLIHPLDPGSKAAALVTGLADRPWVKTITSQDIVIEIIDFYLSYYGKEYPLIEAPRKIEFHLSKDLIITTSTPSYKNLTLDFSKGNQEFPTQFGWKIVINTNTMPMRRGYSCPMFVKTLKLTSLNHLSCKLVSSLIKNFRYVENLIIEECHGLRSLRVEGRVKLKSLSVVNCVDLGSVCVNAYELKSLRYSGPLCSFDLVNVKYLKDVKLDFKGPLFNQVNHLLYDPLLRGIQGVKTLTLHGWMFKEIFGPLLSSKQYFKFSKLQDLWWIDSSMEDRDINSLFGFLRFCTSLERLFISIDSRHYSKPYVGELESTIKVRKGRPHKLQIVKMEGFDNDVDIMLFIEHMMDVFKVEPRFVVKRKGMQDRCLLKIRKHHPHGKAASESDKLKFTYKFVEEVEDDKHPHMP